MENTRFPGLFLAFAVLLTALAVSAALVACDDDADLDEAAEDARADLDKRMDDVRRNISEATAGIAADNIRDVDVVNDQAIVKTDLAADKTEQARGLCEAAIDNPVLSVNTARVEGRDGRILAECRES